MRSHCVEARRARPLLGTFVEIAARAPNETILRRAIAVGFIAVTEVQWRMNRHDPLSELSRLNREAARRKVAVHRSTLAVLRAAERFARESDGAFDITAGSEGSWRDVLIDEDGRVHFRRPLTIDLGGIAKGFAVDRAIAALRKAGAISGIVNAGGDLRVFGDEVQAVQVRHPLDPGHPAGMVHLRDRALATSGRYFSSALVDGRTGGSLPGATSVTVAARDCLTADSLTKIAFALRGAAEELLARYEADAFLLEKGLSPRWLSRR
ncbi:MAG: FAD:protein FMN transferase [Chthoniobacterales bacterium]